MHSTTTHADLCARANIVRTCRECGETKPVRDYTDSPFTGPLGSNLHYCTACQVDAALGEIQFSGGAQLSPTRWDVHLDELPMAGVILRDEERQHYEARTFSCENDVRTVVSSYHEALMDAVAAVASRARSAQAASS